MNSFFKIGFQKFITPSRGAVVTFLCKHCDRHEGYLYHFGAQMGFRTKMTNPQIVPSNAYLVGDRPNSLFRLVEAAQGWPRLVEGSQGRSILVLGLGNGRRVAVAEELMGEVTCTELSANKVLHHVVQNFFNLT